MLTVTNSNYKKEKKRKKRFESHSQITYSFLFGKMCEHGTRNTADAVNDVEMFSSTHLYGQHVTVINRAKFHETCRHENVLSTEKNCLTETGYQPRLQ